MSTPYWAQPLEGKATTAGGGKATTTTGKTGKLGDGRKGVLEGTIKGHGLVHGVTGAAGNEANDGKGDSVNSLLETLQGSGNRDTSTGDLGNGSLVTDDDVEESLVDVDELGEGNSNSVSSAASIKRLDTSKLGSGTANDADDLAETGSEVSSRLGDRCNLAKSLGRILKVLRDFGDLLDNVNDALGNVAGNFAGRAWLRVLAT